MLRCAQEFEDLHREVGLEHIELTSVPNAVVVLCHADSVASAGFGGPSHFHAGGSVSQRADPPSQDRRSLGYLVSSPPLATTNHGKQLGHLIYERRQPSEPLSTNA